jgi:hypothetical protein
LEDSLTTITFANAEWQPLSTTRANIFARLRGVLVDDEGPDFIDQASGILPAVEI